MKDVFRTTLRLDLDKPAERQALNFSGSSAKSKIKRTAH